MKKMSIFGYDTRSLRSALVMAAIDLLNPFKRERAFEWSGPCVVSSIAGLGDLFIHLPLIAGIVNECRRRGIDVRVALRPPLAAIGELCGWDVIPFDDSLVDLFKTPEKFRVSDLMTRVRARRRSERVSLWIDLTGNAVSSLAIKCAGAHSLAARTTRGGRSMIDHALPHRVLENEYENVQRVADYLRCDLDFEIYDRLRADSLPLGDVVALSLTSACRWKAWPLDNFLKLINAFPHVQFALTGFTHEVLAEEQAALTEIRSRPNVVDRMDRLSVVDLVRLIANSGAVVTNDVGAAHIANGFKKPGAVLFGPSSPDAFASRNGLKVFHDNSCPLHPCVQWRCARPGEWCMRKITAADVISYLATLPAFAKREATVCQLQ
ncbi:MAG: hypothetical protein QOG48_384 [Verrucomicrobiota bacterium]